VDLPLTFVGQVGQWHLRRASLCSALTAAGLPLRLMQAPGEEASQIHARSRVSFNCSLNGDLNLRIFEVVASGGCLLTDRLARQSGLPLLFDEDEHYVAYGNAAECVEKARVLLADPQRAAAIARNGKSAYEATLAPERIAEDFFALLERGVVRPEFALGLDKRSALPPSRNTAELAARVALYELLQELQRQRETTRGLVFGDVDSRLVSDAADLPNVLLSIVARGSDAARWRAEMGRAGVADQVALIESDTDLAAAGCDLVIAASRDAAAPAALRALRANRAGMLLLTDRPPSILPEPLAGLGLARLEPGIPLYARTVR